MLILPNINTLWTHRTTHYVLS